MYLIFLQVGKEAVVLCFDVGKEAGVVSFANDDDSQLEIWCFGIG